MRQIERPLALPVDDPLLDTRQLAESTGSTPEFWDQQRTKGLGPDFVKIGRLVRYRKSAFERYLAERTVKSTAEARQLSVQDENMRRAVEAERLANKLGETPGRAASAQPRSKALRERWRL
jgi:hypothetical protein